MSNATCKYEENLLPFFKFQGFGEQVLINEGLRLNDSFIILPLQGRKKVIKLNRTRYEIASNKQYELKIKENKILLPAFKNENFSYLLLLCPRNKNYKDTDKSRYLLKSTSDAPFRLNGMFCFEAFLQRGDVLDLGYNRFEFKEKVFEIKNDENNINIEYIPNMKIIKSDIPILLEGETGTGKTFLAKKIHNLSKRKGRFVHINLAAFSETLVESELFGHVKWAFTGAMSAKKGAFVEAENGTLFLDEIDSLSISLQTKLLLVLDNKEIRPVGGEISRKPNIRIIYASGKNLLKQIKENLMRKDFYFRLSSGVKIKLPTLRDNPKCFDNLCSWYMLKHNLVISPSLIEFYKKREWPGNIREFISHLEKKRIMKRSRIIRFDQEDELVDSGFEIINQSKESENEFITLHKLKYLYTYKVYLKMNKNLDRAAQILGITRNTLKKCLDI